MAGKEWNHGIGRYRKHGCRCEVCSAAYAEYRRSLRKHQDTPPLIDPEPLIKFIIELGEPMTATKTRLMESWRKNGIDIYRVDKLCVARGFHPFEVYGDEWWRVDCEVS